MGLHEPHAMLDACVICFVFISLISCIHGRSSTGSLSKPAWVLCAVPFSAQIRVM